MAVIRPFRALRYNPEQIPSLSDVIAPPYDVISPLEQQELHERSPHNIVRLILSKSDSDIAGGQYPYQEARHTFDEWCSRQILRQDDTPAFYLIEQTFSDPTLVTGAQIPLQSHRRTRLGFIGLLGFESSVERTAYRHEMTLAAPKEDRAKLLSAVPANLSPIFCIYPDVEGRVQMMLCEVAQSKPPTVQADYGDQTIRLWVVTDAQIIQAIQHQLAFVSVLIADGHHRFEVAYGMRHRYNALMSYFVSMQEPALCVQPIHRVVKRTHPAFEQVLRIGCVVEPVKDLPTLMKYLATNLPSTNPSRYPETLGRFGYYDGHAFYAVSMKPERLAKWLENPTVPRLLAGLDVHILHHQILSIWAKDEISSDRQVSTILIKDALWEIVRYSPCAEEVIQSVQRGEGTEAWLLRGIPLEQVYALASQGLSLPPKSTYFYPKILSGLTINPLGNGV